MIVCLPFHEGDIELARLNLKLLSKWTPQPFSCVLCVDDETDPQEIASLAAPVFAEVRTLVYPHYSGPNRQWPRPQNWAWQQTARRMESQPDPWLWWEQDAVPLKPDWLKSLAQAYHDGNQPFMGAWVNYLGHQYMAGVGVYPPRVNAYCPHVLIVEAAAFDVYLGRNISHQCHQINDLIKHTPDPPPGLDKDALQAILSNGTVLFHKCKDGALQQHLLKSDSLISRIGALVNHSVSRLKSSDITVVITNFHRPEALLRAFKSCVAAGVRNLVVSSSGATRAVKYVHEQIKREMPWAVISSIDDDLGCNETWLRGITQVKTKWTHILHDDDWVLPDFAKLDTLIKTVEEGFYLWPGIDSSSKSRCTPFVNLKTGIYSSYAIKAHLMTRGRRSISPVSGLFKTVDLIEVLEECERSFIGPDFFYRPKMMVGNDLMIWLRMADKYPRFYYLDTPLVTFGSWDGSVTYEDIVVNKGKPSKLDPIYNAARNYAASHPSPYLITRKTKTAVFCYVPEASYIGLDRFFENMKEYRTNAELIYLSDCQCPKAPGLIPIPPLVIESGFKPITGHPDLSNPRGLIGTLAWMFSVNIAIEKGIDHFLYLETDCRVTCDDWDKKMFDEYFAWKHGVPLCGGSPVCWHPFVHGYQWDKLVIQYAYEYQQASGMAMAFEGTPNDVCWLYPNGALQIINAKEIAKFWPAQLSDPLRYCRELIPWDLALGVKMTNLLREDTFKRMAWLSCSYSGCKNHHVTETRRMEMIKNKEKVAVHEVKRNDI